MMSFAEGGGVESPPLTVTLLSPIASAGVRMVRQLKVLMVLIMTVFAIVPSALTRC